MTITAPPAGPGASAPAPGLSDDVHQPLRLAAALRMLALVFAYPVPGHRTSVARALSTCDATPRHLASWRTLDEDAAREAYSRLFLGSDACPMVETAWTGTERLGGAAVDLADVQGFYAAFGFHLSPRDRRPADHLTTELEFVSALMLKLAYAAFTGWRDERDVTRLALERFLEAHLGRWAAPFAARIRQAPVAGPYQDAARALERLVGRVCAVYSVAPALVTASFPLPAESDVIDCAHGAVSGLDRQGRLPLPFVGLRGAS